MGCASSDASADDASANKANGFGPLILAARSNDVFKVATLLASGSDVNVTDVYGNTPLINAIEKHSSPVITLLLDKDADVNILNQRNEGALHAAVREDDAKTVSLLAAKGADLETESTEASLTPLLTAASEDKTDAALALIEAGANLNAVDEGLQTSLIWAAANKNERVCRALLAKGALLDEQNTEGWTAVMHAANGNMTSVVMDLLNHGASKQIKNKEKNTVEDVAKEAGFFGLAKKIHEFSPVRSSSSVVVEPGADDEDADAHYNAFLTHDWGHAGGRDNHAAVQRVNEALKAKGLITWFDGDRMSGNIPLKMSSGIDRSDCVVVFGTTRYMEKVGGGNQADNCQLEFMYASKRKTAAKLVPVVMEAAMRNTADWTGPFGMHLGNQLYIDMAGDLDDDEYLAAKVEELFLKISSLMPSN